VTFSGFAPRTEVSRPSPFLRPSREVRSTGRFQAGVFGVRKGFGPRGGAEEGWATTALRLDGWWSGDLEDSTPLALWSGHSGV